MSFEPLDYLRHIQLEAVDYELVWDVVQTHIPQLRNRVADLLEP